jgi:hypothetical protein
MIGITRHLIIAVGLAFTIILLALFTLNKFTIDLFQPRIIFISLPLFIALECYCSFIDFVNMAFSLNLKLSKIIKDKIPVFLNLLRL